MTRADDLAWSSPALAAYLTLDARLAKCRAAATEDPAAEAALLQQMETIWTHDLSREERDWLEYRSFRLSAAKRGGDNVARKLAALWPSAAQREQALGELARCADDPEADRVQLGILKLCEGRVERVAELVGAALQDRRDLLFRAEHPREAATAWAARPDLNGEEQARLSDLRAEDLQEYWEWIRQ